MSNQAALGGRRTVLVVDDDHDIRAAVTDILRAEGFEVVGAANGQVALELLAQGCRPCLVLLDIIMPVLNGLEFLARLAEQPTLASLPVVVMSASTRNVQGVCKVLKWPMKQGELVAAVHAFALTDPASATR